MKKLIAVIVLALALTSVFVEPAHACPVSCYIGPNAGRCAHYCYGR